MHQEHGLIHNLTIELTTQNCKLEAKRLLNPLLNNTRERYTLKVWLANLPRRILVSHPQDIYVGIVRINVVPSPFSLSTSMIPLTLLIVL